MGKAHKQFISSSPGLFMIYRSLVGDINTHTHTLMVTKSDGRNSRMKSRNIINGKQGNKAIEANGNEQNKRNGIKGKESKR